MRGHKGSIFGPARTEGSHWYLFNTGGDQDEIQLNIGMWPTHIRLGIGFQIGRQVVHKLPAFLTFQALLGHRPPLPFRDALLKCLERNGFAIEDRGNPVKGTPEYLVQYLETYVLPHNQKTFVLIGALWEPPVAATKTVEDYRRVFLELMPFYEALILVSGRMTFVA